jgi:hypothetical protein
MVKVHTRTQASGILRTGNRWHGKLILLRRTVN